MGLVKWLCKRFSCNSNCKFNDEMFDMDLHSESLSSFKLKHKDMITIHKILNKRDLHSDEHKHRHKHKHKNKISNI